MLAFLKIFLHIVLCLYVFMSVRVWGRGRKIAHVELSNDTITLNHSGAISLCCYCTVNLPRTGPQPPQPVPKMSSRPCLCQIQVFWSRFFFLTSNLLNSYSNCNKLFLALPLHIRQIFETACKANHTHTWWPNKTPLMTFGDCKCSDGADTSWPLWYGRGRTDMDTLTCLGAWDLLGRPVAMRSPRSGPLSFQ